MCSAGAIRGIVTAPVKQRKQNASEKLQLVTSDETLSRLPIPRSVTLTNAVRPNERLKLTSPSPLQLGCAVKSSLLASGLLGLTIVGLWFVGGGTQPLPAAQADDSPRVGQPLTHENLSVYFLHGTDTMPPGTKVMSLPEALERDLAVVHETSDVNMLAVENKSEDCELFIQSGDIVKGGKQDRMAQRDMLLPPKSGVIPLPAHCVEQGRWTGRGSEDSQRFKSSTKCAVGNEM